MGNESSMDIPIEDRLFYNEELETSQQLVSTLVKTAVASRSDSSGYDAAILQLRTFIAAKQEPIQERLMNYIGSCDPDVFDKLRGSQLEFSVALSGF